MVLSFYNHHFSSVSSSLSRIYKYMYCTCTMPLKPQPQPHPKLQPHSHRHKATFITSHQTPDQSLSDHPRNHKSTSPNKSQPSVRSPDGKTLFRGSRENNSQAKPDAAQRQQTAHWRYVACACLSHTYLSTSKSVRQSNDRATRLATPLYSASGIDLGVQYLCMGKQCYQSRKEEMNAPPVRDGIRR